MSGTNSEGMTSVCLQTRNKKKVKTKLTISKFKVKILANVCPLGDIKIKTNITANVHAQH